MLHKDKLIDSHLKFLLASSRPGITSRLLQCGFDAAERERGWRLYRRAIRVLGAATQRPASARRQEHERLAELDALEDLLFEVASATLTFHAPALHDELFVKLSPAKGRQVVTTMTTFLDRVDVLEQRAEVETEVADVMSLLAARGLTPERRQRGRELLSLLRLPADEAQVDSHERDEVTVALERWRAEWSRLARTVISDAASRRALGAHVARRRPAAAEGAVAPVAAPPTTDAAAVAEQPEPIAEQPEPIAEQPETVAAAEQPATVAAAEQPEPVAAAEQPETVAEQPAPVAEQPAPEQPATVAEQPGCTPDTEQHAA